MAESDDVSLDAQGVLSEQTRVWDAPGSETTGLPLTPGMVGAIKARITREYVSAQPNQWYLNLIRVLPFPIDDITQDFGDDLYERMMFDAMISSGVSTYKAAILEDGLNMTPAITDASHPNYDRAVQFLTDAQRMIDECETDLDNWAWNQLDALMFGNKLAEITYREEYVPRNGVLTRTGSNARLQYTLDSLHCKPRHSVGLTVDTFMRVIGCMALIPGIGMPVYTGNIVTNPSDMPNFLPRDKFALLVHRPRDEDPRGTSILRSAYTAWNLKMQLWGVYAKWLAQFASPTLLGFTAEQAMQIPMLDPLGNPLTNLDGSSLMPPSPEEAMLNALSQVMSSSVAAFPAGSKVEWIEMKGQGQPFMNAFRMLDEQCMTAIHGQTMTTQSPRYGTQALGSVQENTFETLVHQAKAFFVRMFRHDILRLWIRYNWGKQWQHLAPRCSLGQTEAEDFAAEMDVAVRAGYRLSPSQLAGLDERFHMPTRSPQDLEQLQATLGVLEPVGQGGGAGLRGAGAAAQPAQGSQQGAGQLASAVRQATGIKLDPNAPPPAPTGAERRYLNGYRQAA